MGVDANVTIKILNYVGNSGVIYPNSSTQTNKTTGDFYTQIPVFDGKNGKLANYQFELKITPNNNSKILPYTQTLTMTGSEWESGIALGKIVLEEDVKGNQGLPCPY